MSTLPTDRRSQVLLYVRLCGERERPSMTPDDKDRISAALSRIICETLGPDHIIGGHERIMAEAAAITGDPRPNSEPAE